MGSRPLRERGQGLSLIDAADSPTRSDDANISLGIAAGIGVGVEVAKRDMVFKTRHIFGSLLPRVIYLGFACCGVAMALGATTESISEEVLMGDLVGKTRLTSTQITGLFSDVIDRGEVQDQRGISAETYWHADGTFVSRWWTEASQSGVTSDLTGGDAGAVKQQVTGRWRTERDLRCVTFDLGTQPSWSCAEVWLLGDGRVLSLTPNGRVHGVHQVAPLELSAEDPH